MWLFIAIPFHISRTAQYRPQEEIYSRIAPRYQPFIGPILVRWEDYRKGNLQLAIGEYSYTRTEGRFTDEVVCRDVMGALVLSMNLQLENFTNKKNVSSDSSMFWIKKTTINQGIHVGFLEMVLGNDQIFHWRVFRWIFIG